MDDENKQPKELRIGIEGLNRSWILPLSEIPFVTIELLNRESGLISDSKLVAVNIVDGRIVIA